MKLRIRIHRSFLLVALAGLSSSCATIFSMTEDQSIYGGVYCDSVIIKEAFREPDQMEDCGMGHAIAVGFAPFAILDFPLSLVMDTALLPVTATIWALEEDEDPSLASDQTSAP